MSPRVDGIQVIRAENGRGMTGTALMRLMNKPECEQQSSDKAVSIGRMLSYR